MTATRQKAIQMLEKVPEDKLNFVIQIMQGVNGLLESSEGREKGSRRFETVCHGIDRTGAECGRLCKGVTGL